jgi:hypothetical protein
MESEDSAFISQHLTNFKAWVAAKSAPTAPAPKPAARTNRLSNAVIPAGGAAPAQSPVTEEDAFLSAFNKERKSA